jgi:ABC-type polysaccharide/polyol phosphate export permease
LLVTAGWHIASPPIFVHSFATAKLGLLMAVPNLTALRLGVYLTKAEFAKKHAATLGGLFWTIFTPTATILTIWIALDYGLGMRAISGADYGQRLVVGLAAWLFLSEAVLGGSQTIVGNPHFVKKVKFPVILLPAVSVASALIIHIVILILLVCLLLFQGVVPGWQIATLPLWVAAAAIAAASLAIITSALSVLIPDVSALLPSVVGLFFWLTPVVWPLETVVASYRWIFFLNPATIIVEGYRYAILGKPFQLEWLGLLLAMAFVTAVLLIAVLFFRRVQPLFADVI